MEGNLSPADVAVLSGSTGRNNDSFGDGNGCWWIVIFLIFAMFGFGRNGFGGFGGGSTYEGYTLISDFSQISRQLADSTAMTERKLDGVNNGLCSGFYQEAQLLNGLGQNIANAQYNVTSAITTNGYETRNAITQDTIANMQNANALQSQIAQCCCDIKGISKDNRYENLQNINMLNNSINNGFVSVNQANCLNTRDIISSQENGTRAILEALNQNKLEAKNERIQEQQNEINALRLCASQSKQNEYLINQLKPCPSPAYIVPSPYCNCNNGCGCNNF